MSFKVQGSNYSSFIVLLGLVCAKSSCFIVSFTVRGSNYSSFVVLLELGCAKSWCFIVSFKVQGSNYSSFIVLFGVVCAKSLCFIVCLGLGCPKNSCLSCFLASVSFFPLPAMVFCGIPYWGTGTTRHGQGRPGSARVDF
jgi:hypothetical protein